MSEINITYPLDCHVKHSKDTVLAMLTALEEKYSIKHHFLNEHECKLTGTGISGELLLDEAGIEIFVKLGFLMTPFKGTIETEIVNKLDEYFSAHT